MSVSYRIYPHNDLLNLSYHHLKVIRQKLENGVEEGISLDCTSALIALAFSVEAIINFVGTRVEANWKERKSYHKKLKKVCKAASIDMDSENEMLEAIGILKNIRDEIAHGKPIEGEDKLACAESVDKLMKCSPCVRIVVTP